MAVVASTTERPKSNSFTKKPIELNTSRPSTTPLSSDWISSMAVAMRGLR